MSDKKTHHDRQTDIAAALRATQVVFRDFARTQDESLTFSASQRHLLLTFAVEMNNVLLDHKDVASTLGLYVQAFCHGDSAFTPTDAENAILIKNETGRCKDDGCAGCCFIDLKATTKGIDEYLQIAIYPDNTMLAQSSLDRLRDILRKAPIQRMVIENGTIVSEHRVAEDHYPYDLTSETHTASSQEMFLQFINTLRANVKKRTKAFPLEVLRKIKRSPNTPDDNHTNS